MRYRGHGGERISQPMTGLQEMMLAGVWKRWVVSLWWGQKRLPAEGSASTPRRAQLCLTIVSWFINYMYLLQCDRICVNTKFISAQGEAGSPGQKGEQVRPHWMLSGWKRMCSKVTSKLFIWFFLHPTQMCISVKIYWIHLSADYWNMEDCISM